MSNVWLEGCWWRKQVRAGTMETEVSLVGWCEGGLERQRNDGGICATMSKRSERVECPSWYICNWMSISLKCLLGPVFFWTALPCSGGYYLERGGMPLHDAVWINCKIGSTTENQGSAVKYMIFGLYVWWLCAAWLPLLGGVRKSWYIIIIIQFAIRLGLVLPVTVMLNTWYMRQNWMNMFKHFTNTSHSLTTINICIII